MFSATKKILGMIFFLLKGYQQTVHYVPFSVIGYFAMYDTGPIFILKTLNLSHWEIFFLFINCAKRKFLLRILILCKFQ